MSTFFTLFPWFWLFFALVDDYRLYSRVKYLEKELDDASEQLKELQRRIAS
jgi:hypothetical protein